MTAKQLNHEIHEMTDLESESDCSKRSIDLSLYECENSVQCTASTDSMVVTRRRSKNSESVSFSTVEISNYPVVLGDNPSCSAGLPLQLDWTPRTKETYDLDEFERSRGKRRKEGELLIHFLTRQHLIQNSGSCNDDEILERRKELAKVRHQREQSNRMYNFKNRIADFMCRGTAHVSEGTNVKTTCPMRKI